MFRTRPPIYALACVAAWFLLILVHVAGFFLPLSLNPELAFLWYALELACIMVIGGLLLVQLPRALQWRPRRSPRPSPEVQLERQRIARDLHDQVGSQLVNAMALLDAHDTAQRPAFQALEQCMLDVRLLVDSMDIFDDSLADCLARLRHRIQPVLERRGMHLVWAVDTQGDAPLPFGNEARELTNVVKEAISNVLQHSGATQLTVSLGLHGGGPEAPWERTWRLGVADNGKGLPEPRQAALGGHGIGGMRERARTVGGTLELSGRAEGGVLVQVVVPARGAPPEPSRG